MFQIINRIVPIIILLAIGKLFQVTNVFSHETIADIKKLVVNLALPAVLFLSFLFVDLQVELFLFFPIMLVYCILLYLLGIGLHRLLKIKGEYFPFLMTGFEYGMMGVALFGAAYGLEQISKLAIIDLGHEIFIWFVYVALLIRKRDGVTDTGKLIRMFATSPMIIAIFAGLLLNFLGLRDALGDMPLVGGILETVELIGSLTIPLILIVVGYGIQFDRSEFVYSFRVILLRMLINIPVALLLNHFLVRGLMGLDLGFQAALFTLLILPTSFIITLLMKQDLEDEIHSVNNTLTLSTIVSIIVFIIYYALNPVI